MQEHRYVARMGHAVTIAQDASYGELVERVFEFAIRGAVAKAADDFGWEHEEVRRDGLDAIQFAHNGKAIWCDPVCFQSERDEAEREEVLGRFDGTNELDPEFALRLDGALRDRLRRAGYEISCVLHDMKELYAQVAHDVGQQSAQARDELLRDILQPPG